MYRRLMDLIRGAAKDLFWVVAWLAFSFLAGHFAIGIYDLFRVNLAATAVAVMFVTGAVAWLTNRICKLWGYR